MKGRISHKVAARSLRGSRGMWAGQSILVCFCLGELLWPFCMDIDESQILCLNTTWQQAYPLLHSFHFWVMAHILSNGAKQRVETISWNQRCSEFEEPLRDLLGYRLYKPDVVVLWTLAHGPRKREGRERGLCPIHWPACMGCCENREENTGILFLINPLHVWIFILEH